MNYIDYITQSLGKGTVGASISVGIFALIAVFAVIGLYWGLRRGFSKSVIRFFTILLSAFGALYAVMATCSLIINLTNAGESVDQLIESYAPGALDNAPEIIRTVLSEMNSETASIFVMMLVCIAIAPILFILFFYLLKTITFFVYKLLAGLVGAIDYGKGITSMIFGGVIGLIQGVVIAGIVLMPVSGLCGILEVAKEPLLENENESTQQIVDIYDNVFNDLVDNPVFDTIDGFGGKAAYERMVSVNIGDHKINMADESKSVIKLFVDALPVVTPDFNWQDPTEPQKQAFVYMVEDIGQNEFIASIASDMLRGMSACISDGTITVPFEGTNKTLIEDVLGIFSTSTKDNVKEDLDMIIDIYLLMCDKGLIVAFNQGDPDILRELLTERNANGDTIIDEILNRLNENSRGKPVVHTFTKISLSLMQGAMGGSEESAQLYDEVKDDIHTVLSHNKSDFETEEEYKEAVKSDLDKALEENNLSVGEDVREHMVDYIAENYGDTSEITDDDINDAILSYYNSYASAKEDLESAE